MEASSTLASLLNPSVNRLTSSSEIQGENSIQTDILIVFGKALVPESTF
jgi:hypothetical protein